MGGATRPKCEHGTPGSGPQFGHGARLLEACASAARSRPGRAGIAGNMLPWDARLRVCSGSCTQRALFRPEFWRELLRWFVAMGWCCFHIINVHCAFIICNKWTENATGG